MRIIDLNLPLSAYSFLHLITLIDAYKFGRTPLDEGSAHHRDLSSHNTKHSHQTAMRPVGFERTILAGEGQQTYALDCAATGTGKSFTEACNFVL